MPIPKRYYEELQAKREAEHRAAERDKGRALVVTGLICIVWCLLGLLSFGFALHTTDALTGEICRWTAYTLTYGGISATLAWAYLRGERRGDW
jgi:protein-S-isoprenylcysteine O-methyltransferase Ste14